MLGVVSSNILADGAMSLDLLFPHRHFDTSAIIRYSARS